MYELFLFPCPRPRVKPPDSFHLHRVILSCCCFVQPECVLSLQDWCLGCVWESGWLLWSSLHFSWHFWKKLDDLHEPQKIHPRLQYDLILLFLIFLEFTETHLHWHNRDPHYFMHYQAPVRDPVSLVPVSLVPVDPCDIHVEFTDDHISTESSSSPPANQDLTFTCE